jgi:hypothetical protein
VKFTSGLPETRCGIGSTLAATNQIRAWLPGILRELGARTLLDAPCGDRNWIQHVDLGVSYFGVDADPDNKPHELVDLTARCPVLFDVILCRDFLQHISFAEIARVIWNFKTSGALWLIVTNHSNDENRDLNGQGYRPVNLMKPPFGFGAPVYCCDDWEGSLGVWRL